MSIPESVLSQPVSVVRGDAGPEELAALVAVLLTRAAQPVTPAPGGPARPAGWTERSRGLRRPLHPGPGAWTRGLR